ncbi:MAG: hypothetical protein HRU04_10525 [Oceanospirillaceae bacterium]|nr:hypothetical protein [Oceanospirillaceae bacterium]
MNKLVEMGIFVQVSEQGLNGSEGAAAWHNIFIALPACHQVHQHVPAFYGHKLWYQCTVNENWQCW